MQNSTIQDATEAEQSFLRIGKLDTSLKLTRLAADFILQMDCNPCLSDFKFLPGNARLFNDEATLITESICRRGHQGSWQECHFRPGINYRRNSFK